MAKAVRRVSANKSSYSHCRPRTPRSWSARPVHLHRNAESVDLAATGPEAKTAPERARLETCSNSKAANATNEARTRTSRVGRRADGGD